MTQRILIDAVHPEEVRVVLAQDNRLEEFDFETSAKKQIKSNIYLGKITRVEPSLQAAFVEYGGARQGFLPFAEVHYDYYQIPTEDREKIAEILEKERDVRDEAAESDEDRTMSARTPKDPSTRAGSEKPKKTRKTPARKLVRRRAKADEAVEAPEQEAPAAEKPAAEKKKAIVDEAARRKAEELERAFAEEFSGEAAPAEASGEPRGETAGEGREEGRDDRHEGRRNRRDRHRGRRHGRDDRGEHRGAEGRSDDEEGHEEKNAEHEEIGGGDDFEEARHQRSQIFRNYKIQEVLKRNQIVLVQVIKEERGSKGASLTTYISLAGRYCVLMPNTDRAGGISRRITDISMRKQLKSLLSGMNMPKGASVIIRTAGMDRAVEEIRHDFNYLLGLWEDIRTRAVKAVAPALIHEEGNLIKRALRDMFRHTISEVIVEGKGGYAIAKEFMEAMTPESLQKLKEYDGSEPLFRRYGIDAQLDDLYDNEARLPSGGAIVITPTEALVSIDVNSGRSTRERSIEDTALKTNLEAAEEIARQLRLRDLAGLVVIDFIDMREMRNRRAVEGMLKKALRTDRARIQVGRISPFGLLEMSRQRMRSSIVEASTVSCRACGGTGFVRSDESTALKLLRVIEGEAMKEHVQEVAIRTATAAAFYLLNNKREELSAIERDQNVKVLIDHDHTLAGADYLIGRNRGQQQGQQQRDEHRGGRDRDRGRDRNRGGRDRDNRHRDQRGEHRGDRQHERHDQEGNRQPVEAEAVDGNAQGSDNAQPHRDDHYQGGHGGGRRNRRRNRRGRDRHNGERHHGERQGGYRGDDHGNRSEHPQEGGRHDDEAHAPRETVAEFPATERREPRDAGGEDAGGRDMAYAASAGAGDDGKDASRLRGLWKKITQ